MRLQKNSGCSTSRQLGVGKLILQSVGARRAGACQLYRGPPPSAEGTAQQSGRPFSFGAPCHRPFAGQSCSPPSCLSGVDDFCDCGRVENSVRARAAGHNEGLSTRDGKSGICLQVPSSNNNNNWNLPPFHAKSFLLSRRASGIEKAFDRKSGRLQTMAAATAAAAATPGSATGPTRKTLFRKSGGGKNPQIYFLFRPRHLPCLAHSDFCRLFAFCLQMSSSHQRPSTRMRRRIKRTRVRKII